MSYKHSLFYIVIIIVLLSVEMILFDKYNVLYKKTKDCMAENYRNKELVKTAGISTTLLTYNVARSYKYENVKIQDILLEDEKGNTLKLSRLMSDTDYKIVFFFSYLNCESCVSNILTEIEEACSDINKEDIIIVGEFANRRAVIAYSKRVKFPFTIYYKNEKQKIDILDLENTPFVCVMTSNLVARDLIFPVKEVPLFLEAYLEVINEKYFRN